MELLRGEMLKGKPRTAVLKDLMRRTFSNRWKKYLSESTSLTSYLHDFPLLKKAVYVCKPHILLCIHTQCVCVCVCARTRMHACECTFVHVCLTCELLDVFMHAV